MRLEGFAVVELGEDFAQASRQMLIPFALDLGEPHPGASLVGKVAGPPDPGDEGLDLLTERAPHSLEVADEVGFDFAEKQQGEVHLVGRCRFPPPFEGLLSPGEFAGDLLGDERCVKEPHGMLQKKAKAA